MRTLLIAALLLTASLPALAQDKSAYPASAARLEAKTGCTMMENVTLSANFNLRAASFADAKKKYDEKMAQIESLATQQGIKNLELQSASYNVNSANNPGESPDFQMNGNASFRMQSTEQAFKLGELLNQQRLHVSVNGSKYRNGNCSPTQLGQE